MKKKKPIQVDLVYLWKSPLIVWVATYNMQQIGERETKEEDEGRRDKDIRYQTIMREVNNPKEFCFQKIGDRREKEASRIQSPRDF